MKLITIVAAILALASIAAAQEIQRVSGVIQNKNFEVVPGLSLSLQKDGKDYTRDGYRRGGSSDINGHFELDLEPGNYKITASGIPENQFVLFLNIDDGPRPDRLDLTVDTSSLCPTSYPAVLKSVAPTYPHAARAVRAVGQVSVEITTSPDGSVTSAKALSGHPLLRATSQNAAREFIFESSNDPERKIVLAFIFDGSSEKQSDVSRYECAYRIVVNYPPSTIDISEN